MTKAAPFRADHVGSLLRPAELKTARARFARNEISASELKAIEDQAIKRLIAKQESIGLKSITDGEFRRENWSLDFFTGLDGIKVVLMATAPRAHGGSTEISNTLKVATVSKKLGTTSGSHPMIEHFKFLKANTHATAKITIPCPTMLTSASRDWKPVVANSPYKDLDALYEDLGATYKKLIQSFYDAGCRYLQLDDVNMSYLCDAKMREQITARGEKPEEVLKRWVKVLNVAIGGRPADMAITTHICRGNFKSAWFASGGYEPIAETLFNELNYDGYFLEYDTDRAGGFEPLRFVPKGDKRIVLGLMTTKTGSLEASDLIKSRIDGATKFVNLNQLCLSPQCGFASHEDGNLLSEDEQWAKLGQIVSIAKDIWADA